MKTFLTRVLPATALSAVLLSSAAWAYGDRGDIDPERMVEHMAKRLDLSAEQQAQVEAIVAENADQNRADRERAKEIRDALKSQQANFDAGETQALTDELGEITARMAYERASDRARIHEVLTDEQRAEMAQMRDKHSERKGKWRRGE